MEHLIPCQDLGEGNSPESQGGSREHPWATGELGVGWLKGALHPLPLLPMAKMCLGALLKSLPGWSWLTCPTPPVPSQQCLVEPQGGWDMPGGAAGLNTAQNSGACSGCAEMDDPWRQGPWKATFDLRGRAPCALIPLT